MEIQSKNTNTLTPVVFKALLQHGVRGESRNGPVLRIPEPVSICIKRPWERVNFSLLRDANPFFHLIESLAMLAPVNSVTLMSHFASNMKSFSDDGNSYNAFYGTRAREWSVMPEGVMADMDQLDLIITELLNKPESRQCVVQLWDPQDLVTVTKDKACNLCLLFEILNGRVKMTSFNRSNDAVLGGVCGANVVHLSYFHEYVALALGMPMGDWWHVSNNLHVYTDHPKWQVMAHCDDSDDAYTGMVDQPLPLYHNRQVFDRECLSFMARAAATCTVGSVFDEKEFRTPFLSHTAVRAYNAWQRYKAGDKLSAHMQCTMIHSEDWRIACCRWMDRRINNTK